MAGRDLNAVYHIDENGKLTARVYFCEEVFHSNGIEAYLVAIPEYINEDRATEITQEMKAKAYYSEEDELYLFKVTAEQYEQLTEKNDQMNLFTEQTELTVEMYDEETVDIKNIFLICKRENYYSMILV